MEHIDFSLVDWSRWQFAMTAMYHWIFVSLTLGLALIVTLMETIYVRTGERQWKNLTKFWMVIFGVNLALGVATGIILEFQFGTNWSNYSWFVGDVFGAPLAIEGVLAFFLKATFIAVMFFGWNRVSKRFHLLSTWLVSISVCLSALWILIANAWMQYPVGMQFNPDMARNEMINFWEVIFSPVAISKFLHSVSSGFITGAVVVVGISAWYLMKNRHKEMARKSILVGAIVGLVGSAIVIISGHSAAKNVAETQPMKMAVMEALYEGKEGAPFSVVAFGKSAGDPQRPYMREQVDITIPKILSIIAKGDANAFVPGIVDLIEGNNKHDIMPARERARRGKQAQETLKAMTDAKDVDAAEYARLRAMFDDKVWVDNYLVHFGYGYFYDENPQKMTEKIAKLVPNVPLNYWSFRIMIGLGFLFIAVFVLLGWFAHKNTLENRTKLYKLAIVCIPLVYISTWAGWIVAEVGRQPWIVQDLMPTFAGTTSEMATSAVKTTFFLFAVTFTVLLVAALKIVFTQIKKGPKEE